MSSPATSAPTMAVLALGTTLVELLPFFAGYRLTSYGPFLERSLNEYNADELPFACAMRGAPSLVEGSTRAAS